MKPDKLFDSVLKSADGHFGAWRQESAGAEYLVTTDGHRIFASRSVGRLVAGRTASIDSLREIVESALEAPRTRLKGAVLDSLAVRHPSVIVSLWHGPSEDLVGQGHITGSTLALAEGQQLPTVPREAVSFAGPYFSDATFLTRKRKVRGTLHVDPIYVGLRGPLDPTVFAREQDGLPEHIYLVMPVAR